MEKQVKPGLKYTFLVHFVVALIFGLGFLLIPEAFGQLFNWPVLDPPTYRLLGAAILGYATSSILAYRETAWDKVIIVVRMEIIWAGLATLVLLWGVIFADQPAIGWLFAAIFAAFTAAFSVFYNPA
jgi:hypothetical protein